MTTSRRMTVALAVALAFISALGSATAHGIAPPSTVRADSRLSSLLTAGTAKQMTGWKTYHSATAGYSVDYPSNWTVTEQTVATGWTRTVFAPLDGRAKIYVTVRPISTETDTRANVRCSRVQVGGLTGRACFSTLSFTMVTTFVTQGRSYAISMSMRSPKNANSGAYHRIVASFRPV